MGGCCDKFGTCARITAMMFTAAGLAFSILAAQSCEFLEYGNDKKLGLFQYTNQDGQCVDYPTDDLPLGGTDTAARTCGLLAAIFGLIALVLLLFEFCICKLWCARFIESLVYAVAYICQGCTFLVYNNAVACTSGVGYSCNWGQGSVWSVVALCLYFVASCIMCCTPRSDPLLCKHRQSKKEEKEARQMADEDEAKDKAASDSEKGGSEPEQADSTPAAASSGDDDAAAHASAY